MEILYIALLMWKCDDKLAQLAERDTIFLTAFVEEVSAPKTEASLERIGRVIQAFRSDCQP